MTQQPNEEQRGGDKPDWDNAVAGEPLPEREEPGALPEEDGPDMEKIFTWGCS